VLGWLDTSTEGLSSGEAADRLARLGPNSLRTHRVSAWAVLRRQLNNAVLALLAATAVVSYFLGDGTQAVIIGIILVVSIGLGFINEYRAERASAALHSSVHHNAVVRRDGSYVKLDVNGLVPGDVIELALGELVPADVRLLTVNGLECNESQILLNNLLYDSSQLAIPTDRVDAEQLQAPSHWNIAFIRRFMLTFGPISSLFDFLTFGLMLGALHAGPVEFRTGWFVESLATQTLIIFAIRTRRIPFVRSRPGGWLTLTTLSVIAIGIALTVSPFARALGFTTLPWQFFGALALFTVAYLVLVEITKKVFYAEPTRGAGLPHRTRGREHRIHRRAARFSHGGRLPQPLDVPALAGTKGLS
jgi:magnesium-transporting ATPase (P-type)